MRLAVPFAMSLKSNNSDGCPPDHALQELGETIKKIPTLEVTESEVLLNGPSTDLPGIARCDRRGMRISVLALKSKSIMSGRRHGNRVGRAPHNRQNESKPGVPRTAIGLMMTSILWATRTNIADSN